ncbi:hypothetical protein DSM104299_00788 [Baekduia alba]|uniref:hypothetical protein n=1 Tax=Baekduia alba TaxID=2997333 RepID=UPI002341C716|nr:hypothetical protein [Baekduia alba]WCB92103.1 hypothetical protein DSM104299_00788 [Baekduia alba]
MVNANRGIKAVVALALVAGLSTVPANAATRTQKVDIKGHVNPTAKGSTKFTGTYSGMPWGKGKLTGTLVVPVVTMTFHIKSCKCTATLRYAGKVSGTTFTATYQWIKGTGKYKRIRGKGKTTGSIVTGDFRHVGTLTY